MADKKLALVDGWRNAANWASIRWAAVGFVMSAVDTGQSIWTSLDNGTRGRIPYASTIGMVLFVGTILGRLLVWVHNKTDTEEATDGVASTEQ